MTGTATATKLQDILALTQTLSDNERNRLKELLNRAEDAPLPESATIDEAIELYLADACSVGRAAELAGVTRWDVMDRMKERGIKMIVPGERTAAEMDALANELRREGML